MLHALPGIANLLDGLLHSRRGFAGFLRLIADFVVLSSGHARPVLLAPSAGPFLRFCHALPSSVLNYSSETRTTPDRIIPRARAALRERSMTRPRINGPLSVTRQLIDRSPCETLTMLPKGRVRCAQVISPGRARLP